MWALPLLAGLLAGCQLAFPLTGGEPASDARRDAPVDSFCADVLDCDQDGIPDLTDNCAEVPNPDQANEDADEVGDLCDPCPISSVNDDSDKDGVGDACDPNPNTEGDVIVVFEGFEGGVPASWTTKGSWLAQSGSVAVTVGDNLDAYLAPPVDATVNGTASVAFLATSAPVPRAGLGLGHRISTSSSDGLACQLYVTADDKEIFGYLDTATSAVLDSKSYDWSVGQLYRIVSQRKGSQSMCSLADEPLLVATVTEAMGTAVAVRVEGMAGRFEWLMFVTSP